MSEATETVPLARDLAERINREVNLAHALGFTVLMPEDLQALRTALDSKVPDTPNSGAEVQKLRADLSDVAESWREKCGALRQALEVIALGDAEDPVRDAGDTLVELGYWRAEALEGHRAEAKSKTPNLWDEIAHLQKASRAKDRLIVRLQAQVKDLKASRDHFKRLYVQERMS